MLINQFKVLTNEIPETIEKILYEMQALAVNGKQHWSGVVFNNINNIKRFFTEQGFNVSVDKFHVLTISWE